MTSRCKCGRFIKARETFCPGCFTAEEAELDRIAQSNGDRPEQSYPLVNDACNEVGLGYSDSTETTTTTYRTKPPTQAEIDELRRQIAARELALGLYRTEAAWSVNANAVSLVQSASDGAKAQVKPRFRRWRKRR